MTCHYARKTEYTEVFVPLYGWLSSLCRVVEFLFDLSIGPNSGNCMYRVVTLQAAVSSHIPSYSPVSSVARLTQRCITIPAAASPHSNSTANCQPQCKGAVYEFWWLKIFLTGCVFQPSAAKQMRTALFCAVTQRIVVIPYPRFCSETSVRNYHYSLSNILGERSPHPDELLLIISKLSNPMH